MESPTSSGTELVVSGHGQSRRMPLDPKGVILGRAPTCDVVLESQRVSRRHARLFRDPFGRWVVEDMASRHGVWIAGQRIEARAVLPGEKIVIGPFTLTVVQPLAAETGVDTKVMIASTILDEDAGTQVIEPQAEQPLSRNRLQQLNDLVDQLSPLSAARELYPEACRALAESPNMAAVILRLPASGQVLSLSPRILACHLGGARNGEGGEETPMNLHLSRRVLEAARSGGNAVMAGSAGVSEQELALTVVDAARPRAVFCAPIAELSESLDVLYVDVPVEAKSTDMLDFVRAAARQIGMVQKGLLLAEAKAESRVLDQQLSLARKIQSRLIPTQPHPVEGLDLAVSYQPAMWVGGDYCDVWRLGDGRLAFAVGDVCGKGLPAAMVMASLQAALRATMSFCCDLSQVIAHVQEQLQRHLPEDMFVTLVLGLFEPSQGRLEYVNAGHILPLLFGPSKEPWALGEPTNPPLGAMEGPFRTCVELVPPQTGLVVVTDGVTEVASPAGELFGSERLRQLIAGAEIRSAGQAVKAITDAVSLFRQDLPQQDDITVFALIHRGAGGSAGS